MRNTVLVTGSTGFLGSWLVTRLLEKGYYVKASVLDRDDKNDLEPLLGLAPSLAQNLEIVEANILTDGVLDCHVEGCEGVFHLAFHVTIHAEADLEKEMIEPAVQGSLNVLKSCAKSSTVKRVVYASSCAAACNCDYPLIKDESCWTDLEAIKKWNGWEYGVAKTLGEKAATEFAKENKLDLVVINPGFVLGPYLLSRIPASVLGAIPFLAGKVDLIGLSRSSTAAVHTDDVARAFIYLYETPEAAGRHMCANGALSGVQFLNAVRSQCPEMIGNNVTKRPLDQEGEVENDSDSSTDNAKDKVLGVDSSKLKRLGFQFHYSVEDMVNDFIKCTRSKGLILS